MKRMLPVPEAAQKAMIARQKGEHHRARELLLQALQDDPTSERLWLWLSWVVETPAEHAKCIDALRAINPMHPVFRHVAQATQEQQQAARNITNTAPQPSHQAAPPATQQQQHAMPIAPSSQELIRMYDTDAAWNVLMQSDVSIKEVIALYPLTNPLTHDTQDTSTHQDVVVAQPDVSALRVKQLIVRYDIT